MVDRAAKIVDITCITKDDILLKGDADVWSDYDYLVTNAVGATFELMQKCIGINYLPTGLLFARELRPAFKPSSSHRYDGLHVLFANGLVPPEFMLFFTEAKRIGRIYFVAVREYFDHWGWQTQGTHKPGRAFSEARENSSHGTLKAGASEIIIVYPFVRHFVLLNFLRDPDMRLAERSLMLLLDVVDLILKANRRLQDVEKLADRLDAAVFAYLKAFTDAYGFAAMKHKHHELIHLAAQLRMDKLLFWCFTAERKHILAKSVMDNSKKMTSFQLGSVSRMFASQVACLKKPGWLSKLHPLEQDFPEFATAVNASCCRIGRSMRWNETDTHHGYPLFVGPGRSVLVLVVACLVADGNFGIVGHRCIRVRGDVIASDWTVLAEIDHHGLVSTDCVEVARGWRRPHGDCLTVLH